MRKFIIFSLLSILLTGCASLQHQSESAKPERFRRLAAETF